MYRSGGVELVAQGGRIRVVNTLDSRLDLMSRQVGLFLNNPGEGVDGPACTGFPLYTNVSFIHFIQSTKLCRHYWYYIALTGPCQCKPLYPRRCFFLPL